jgi:Transglycosylase SLT domain
VIYAPGNVALWSTNTYKQTYADLQLPAHGWGASQASQFSCLNNIWVRESNWNELAGNPNHAYGIPQSNPGSKMASEGSDWLTNPQTQIRWGEDYIQGKYGSPCQAWAYWQTHHNY